MSSALFFSLSMTIISYNIVLPSTRADVWSAGCILAELLLGHKQFVELWMSAYEMDNLKNTEQFGALVSANVGGLFLTLQEDGRMERGMADSCTSNDKDSNGFKLAVELLENMLTIDHEKRLNMCDVYTSAWIGGEVGALTSNRISTSSCGGSLKDSNGARSLSRTPSRDSLLGSVLLKRPLSASIERRPSARTREALEGTFAGRAALTAKRPLSASSDLESRNIDRSALSLITRRFV